MAARGAGRVIRRAGHARRWRAPLLAVVGAPRSRRGDVASSPCSAPPGPPGINVLPVPLPDAYTVVHDRKLHVDRPGVLANDIDADGDHLRRGSSRARRTVTWTSTTTGRSPTSRTTATRASTASPTRRTTARSASPRWSRSRSPTSPRSGDDDHYMTKQDVKIQVDRPGVLRNDDDADGDHLKAKLVSGPATASSTCTTRASSSTSPHTGSRARTCSPIGPSTAPTSPR